MQALANEVYTPRDQYQKKPGAESVAAEDLKFEEHFEVKQGAKSYEIRALSSLQLTEVMAGGFDSNNRKMNFAGIMLLLRYGLVDPSAISAMSSVHHVDVAQAIYLKASMAEAERKN